MSAAKRRWATVFYWIGVAMALACVVFVSAGNTELIWRFEHTSIPLSWALAGAAVIAFLAFELADSSSSLPSEVEDRSLQFSSEWQAVEL